MNRAILHKEVQDFIQKNTSSDVVKISLGKSPFPGVSPKELAQQIDSRRRCEFKLPLWYNTDHIYYPEKLAIEQCSSETAAKYKSDLLFGDKVIDLTGGFGVDAGFFSKKVKEVTHCEINTDLSDISKYNSDILGFRINYIKAEGIEHLCSSAETYDTIYIDPSRRISSRKVFLLKDCEPDVVQHRDLLLQRSSRLLIKTAPLLDLQSTINELQAVSQVHIISIKNECKEVLYLVDRESSETDPLVTCALLNNDQSFVYTFRLSEEKAFVPDEYSAPPEYLYEPDVALLKAGCFKLITRDFNVQKIHQHTHLYTSDSLNDTFPGRKFRILSTWDYGAFIKENKFNKANIICRNFPVEPEKIRKKLKINDGGDDYLIFCTGNKNELLAIHCERIS